MAVTVGIAVAGDGPPVTRETVEAAIHSASLVGDDAEVLVVTDSRTPVACLAGIGSPLLRVRHLDRGELASARNTVLAEARHDTVLFTEPDCAVPPGWCAHLATELRRFAAVTASVRVTVAGPIGAYLDYCRIAEPDPAGVDPSGTLALVTANCGLRRDLIPAGARFDPCLDGTGEAVGLSLQLGRAGLPVRWLAGAPAVRRRCAEEIEEITDRFMSGARHGLHRYLGHGHVAAAMPGILNLYRQRVGDDCRIDRRFGEFVAAEARTAFSVYDSLAAAAQAIGYLDALGGEFGHPLLELDLDGLSRAWRAVADRVRERTSRLAQSDWANLELDYPGMQERLGLPDPLLAEVRESLRRHARPSPIDPVGRLGEVADHGLVEVTTAYLSGMERVRAAFDELRAGPPPVTADALERAVRAAGMPAKAAGEAIEFSLRFDYRRLVGAWRSGGIR